MSEDDSSSSDEIFYPGGTTSRGSSTSGRSPRLARVAPTQTARSSALLSASDTPLVSVSRSRSSGATAVPSSSSWRRGSQSSSTGADSLPTSTCSSPRGARVGRNRTVPPKLDAILDAMRSEATGVEVRDLRVGKRIVEQAFRATDAVEWLQARYVMDEAAALVACQKLLDDGMLVSTSNASVFTNTAESVFRWAGRGNEGAASKRTLPRHSGPSPELPSLLSSLVKRHSAQHICVYGPVDVARGLSSLKPAYCRPIHDDPARVPSDLRPLPALKAIALRSMHTTRTLLQEILREPGLEGVWVCFLCFPHAHSPASSLWPAGAG